MKWVWFRKVADLVVSMDAGCIVEAAPPEEFLQPQNERTRSFLSQVLHTLRQGSNS